MEHARHCRAGTPEERVCSALHGVGFGLSVAGLVILVLRAGSRGDAWDIVSVSIFGASLVLLYLASTLAHAFSAARCGRLLELCDRSAIYLLIAGTYTPFTLTALRGGWGWSLFGVIWGLALCGIVFGAFSRHGFSAATCLLYLLMGWTVVIAIAPVLRRFSSATVGWLLLGGVLYSVGVLFFLDTRRHSHALWHACVLAGSICHFFAVFSVLPR